MDQQDAYIVDALHRIVAVTEIARWLWLVNLAVMIVGIWTRRYELAVLGGFTWLLSLVAAAIAKKVAVHLTIARESLRSSTESFDVKWSLQNNRAA